MSELAAPPAAQPASAVPPPADAPRRRPSRGRPSSPLRDTVTMIGRGVRLNTRSVEAMLTALLLPVMIMLLFVYLFGGAIQVGTAYVNYAVAGVLVLCTGFVSSQTAIAVTEDMTRGMVDRFRSMDVSGAAVLTGHVASSVVRNTAATLLVLGVAYAIGFRPDAGPLEWLGAAGILLLFVLAISWLSAMVGLLVKSVEGAGGFTFFVMFLPYPSSGFVPVETMPSFLRNFAEHQPVTPVIESLRGLLTGAPMGSSGWLAVAWCTGITVVAVVAAAFLFRRRTS